MILSPSPLLLLPSELERKAGVCGRLVLEFPIRGSDHVVPGTNLRAFCRKQTHWDKSVDSVTLIRYTLPML